MEWRTAAAVCGLLGLVCVGLVLSVALPAGAAPAESAPGGADPHEATDEFRAVGTHTADGEVLFDYEGAVAPDGPRYESFRSGDDHRERYQAEPGAPVYVRHTLEQPTADAVRQDVVEDPDRRLLRETDREDGLRLVYVHEDRDDLAPEVAQTASFFLFVPAPYLNFERTSGTGDRAVYEPRGGWFELGEGRVRTTDASGELVVDTSRNLTTSADLTWRTSGGASNYAEDFLAERVTFELSYELADEDVTVSRPDWVEDAREER